MYNYVNWQLTFRGLVLAIRLDEGLMLILDTSVFKSLYGGQFTSIHLMKPNYFVKLPTDAHHSFFRNLPTRQTTTIPFRDLYH